jgi:hypothetical protein
MKAPLSHFSWVKLAAAALTLGTINPSPQAQTSKLIFDSGDEIDTVTFDPAKLRELMLLSPYIVTYFDQLPARDMQAAGSTEGSVVDKIFFPLDLELCIPAEVAYVHCEANDVSGPNFLPKRGSQPKKGQTWAGLATESRCSQRAGAGDEIPGGWTSIFNSVRGNWIEVLLDTG